MGGWGGGGGGRGHGVVQFIKIYMLLRKDLDGIFIIKKYCYLI